MRYAIPVSMALCTCAKPPHVDGPPPIAALDVAPVSTIAANDYEEPPHKVRGMLHVAGGEFRRGCSPLDDQCYSNERPGRDIHIDAFFIDRLEVTVADYRRCVRESACSEDLVFAHAHTQSSHNAPSGGLNNSTSSPPESHDDCNWNHIERADHPMNCIDWPQAKRFCEWAGKRLPTEAEWEKAARGDTMWIYPWGNEPPTCERAVMSDDGDGCGRNSTHPVGQKLAGRSPLGAHDIIGNVWEWTADWYDEVWYTASPSRNPVGPKQAQYRVVKGGGWIDKPNNNSSNSLRISNRYSYRPDLRFYWVGFRCAKSAR